MGYWYSMHIRSGILYQGILALGFCIVLWIKFLQSDVSIPIEVFTGFVGLIVGFFFRDATK
jgi:hypothetical protein